MIERSPPAALVFTLGPECEHRRRRLLPESASALERALHHRGLERATHGAILAGCELFVAAPRPLEIPSPGRFIPQTTGPFGHRLRAAVRRVLETRSGPLVVIGTDCPDLGPTQIRAALRRLEADPTAVVLGPADDGGVYLIAAAVPIDRALAATTWCARSTFRSLRRALAADGHRVVVLEPLIDLDRRSDLQRWLRRGRQRPSWSFELSKALGGAHARAEASPALRDRAAGRSAAPPRGPPAPS